MNDTVDIQIKLRIPRSLYHFIIEFSALVGIEPSKFIYDALMYALSQLFEEELEAKGFVV